MPKNKDKQKQAETGLGRSKMAESFRRIKRRAMPATESGTKYRHTQLSSLKSIEMEKWADLPGFKGANSDAFTWHHMVPQSKVTSRDLAENPAMIRLGPAAGARYNDPGNTYADLNHDETGTLTPVSEAIDNVLEQNAQNALDLSGLTQALEKVVEEQQQKGNLSDKSFSSAPDTWFVLADTLKFLTKGACESDAVAKVIKNNSTAIQYLNSGAEEQEVLQGTGVQITTLTEKNIAGIVGPAKASGVFLDFHNALKGKNNIYVRAFFSSPIDRAKSAARKDLVPEVMEQFPGLVDADRKIAELAMLFTQGIGHLPLLMEKFNRMKSRLKALEIGNQPSKDFYYPGEQLAIDDHLLGRVSEEAQRLRDEKKEWKGAHKFSQIVAKRKASPKEMEQLPMLLGVLEEAEWPSQEQIEQLRQNLGPAIQEQIDKLNFEQVTNWPRQVDNKGHAKKSAGVVPTFVASASERDALRKARHSKSNPKHKAEVTRAENWAKERKTTVEAHIQDTRPGIEAELLKTEVGKLSEQMQKRKGEGKRAAALERQDDIISELHQTAEEFLSMAANPPSFDREQAPHLILNTFWTEGWLRHKTRLESRLSGAQIEFDPKTTDDLPRFEKELKTHMEGLRAEAVQQLAAEVESAVKGEG